MLFALKEQNEDLRNGTKKDFIIEMPRFTVKGTIYLIGRTEEKQRQDTINDETINQKQETNNR